MNLDITDSKHLRWGSGKPRFRKKVQDWMNENVGIHGINWHIKCNPQGRENPPRWNLVCPADKAILFKLVWL